MCLTFLFFSHRLSLPTVTGTIPLIFFCQRFDLLHVGFLSVGRRCFSNRSLTVEFYAEGSSLFVAVVRKSRTSMTNALKKKMKV